MVHNAKVRHRVQDLIDHVDDAVGCDHVVALNPGSVDGHNILKQNDSMPATLRNRYMVLFRKKIDIIMNVLWRPKAIDNYPV